MALVGLINTIIEWGFYALFFLVPLIFTSATSELFEYNKMMLTYGLTIIIALAWVTKMVLTKKIIYRRTFLEIPLLLYLASHILSTLFSIDIHTSIWGYYSRFHEGLLATASYLLLYFAAVSNLQKRQAINILKISFASGVIVSLWGFAEHFGASPSCLLFTGKFDDTCWIQDVKNRVFATLGQPNWMAAYLDILILAALGFLGKNESQPVQNENVKYKKEDVRKKTDQKVPFLNFSKITYLSLAIIYFIALLFTKSRSGVGGLIVGLAFFGGLLIINNLRNLRSLQPFLLFSFFFLLFSLIFGLPFSQTEKFTLGNLFSRNSSAPATATAPATVSNPEIEISESGDIRKVVWEGAIKVWERYPVFGSGVETFAYAYYKDRPAAHNLLSEWDFLYNKAHNEYLNLLATTGSVGMLTYLAVILVFAIWTMRIFTNYLRINTYVQTRNHTSSLRPQSEASHQPPVTNYYLIFALFGAYITILITNFFGFSVVIIGIFFFLIPAVCYLILLEPVPAISMVPNPRFGKSPPVKQAIPGLFSWSLIAGLTLLAGYMEINLLTMWQADTDYALAQNYAKAGQYVESYRRDQESISLNPGEPLYRDDFSYSAAVLASAAQKENQATLSAQLADQAIQNSNIAVTTSPNNVNFWKTRTKVFYQLTSLDPKMAGQALEAITHAVSLAPTDAKVHYNYALLLDAVGQNDAAITALEETVAMKENYRDARYQLGLLYQKAGKINLARQQMEYILQHIGPDNDAQKFLEENK